MTFNRLADYLEHMRQAASDACSFVEGLSKAEFLTDKRTVIGLPTGTLKSTLKWFGRQFVLHCRSC
jgi:hypothetical protein